MKLYHCENHYTETYKKNPTQESCSGRTCLVVVDANRNRIMVSLINAKQQNLENVYIFLFYLPNFSYLFSSYMNAITTQYYKLLTWLKLIYQQFVFTVVDANRNRIMVSLINAKQQNLENVYIFLFYLPNFSYLFSSYMNAITTQYYKLLTWLKLIYQQFVFTEQSVFIDENRKKKA